MKALGILTWIAISSLVSAFVSSWTMQCLWRWFLAHDYGHGPSLGAWFGIASISGLMFRLGTATNAKAESKSSDSYWLEAALHSVGVWIGCMLTLAIAWCIGSVIGWIP